VKSASVLNRSLPERSGYVHCADVDAARASAQALLKTMIGLVKPRAGRIQLDGRRIYTGGAIGENHLRSVTSVKPEKVFKSRTPWGTVVTLDALRAAEWVVAHREDIDEYLDINALIEDVAGAPTVWLAEAGGRGTRIHDTIAEEVLAA